MKQYDIGIGSIFKTLFLGSADNYLIYTKKLFNTDQIPKNIFNVISSSFAHLIPRTSKFTPFQVISLYQFFLLLENDIDKINYNVRGENNDFYKHFL